MRKFIVITVIACIVMFFVAKKFENKVENTVNKRISTYQSFLTD
jgi:hypothetical protein